MKITNSTGRKAAAQNITLVLVKPGHTTGITVVLPPGAFVFASNTMALTNSVIIQKRKNNVNVQRISVPKNLQEYEVYAEESSLSLPTPIEEEKTVKKEKPAKKKKSAKKEKSAKKKKSTKKEKPATDSYEEAEQAAIKYMKKESSEGTTKEEQKN